MPETKPPLALKAFRGTISLNIVNGIGNPRKIKNPDKPNAIRESGGVVIRNYKKLTLVPNELIAKTLRLPIRSAKCPPTGCVTKPVIIIIKTDILLQIRSV